MLAPAELLRGDNGKPKAPDQATGCRVSPCLGAGGLALLVAAMKRRRSHLAKWGYLRGKMLHFEVL
jgi:hypothetical protein